MTEDNAKKNCLQDPGCNAVTCVAKLGCAMRATKILEEAPEHQTYVLKGKCGNKPAEGI